MEKVFLTTMLALVKGCEGECSQHLLKGKDENIDINIKSNECSLQMN